MLTRAKHGTRVLNLVAVFDSKYAHMPVLIFKSSLFTPILETQIYQPLVEPMCIFWTLRVEKKSLAEVQSGLQIYPFKVATSSVEKVMPPKKAEAEVEKQNVGA